MHSLRRLEDGYLRRDSTVIATFVEDLFDPNDVVILGTDPGERYVGRDEVTQLLRADWSAWGHVRFALDSTRISSAGDVAWVIAPASLTVGKRTVPLRFSAVLARDTVSWRFRQVQFQADVAPFASVRRERATFAALALFCVIVLTAAWWIGRRRSGSNT
jgi:ketosteroid isomerase-like protein